MLENFREAFDGIRSHKLRSALTMLGIIIGIASIIAISSTIMGTNEQIKQNLVGSGSNVVTVRLYQGDYPFESSWSTVPEYVPLLTDETLSEVRKVDEIVSASYFTQRDAYGQIWYGNKALSSGTIYGVDDAYLSVQGYTVRAGRGFTENDFSAFRKVALIDETVSAALFAGENPIGKPIEIRGEPYTVIGEFTRASAFKPTVNTLQDYFTYNTSTGGKVLIPMSTWPVLFRFDEPVSLALRAVSTDAMTDAGRKAEELLNATILKEDAEVRYKSENLLEQAKNLQELSSATNRQLILVAGISLIVGGIGVMNIMLVSVTERTPEIGLKKALGARRRRISAQFLIEAGVLTCLGGILGVLVGIGLAYGISKMSGVPIYISWYIIAATVVFSFIIGMFFGAIPAYRAARLDPIEALRHE
ncbi:MAG: ABC transporter permease [Clostridia bacterium]|nr:ABC transporter permease [Clostridia bacterium]